MSIATTIRMTVSRLTWLRDLHWGPPTFPELERDWDFVRPTNYYRVHRTWDPFLHGPERRATLAATDAPRALFYADSKAESDVLPLGYAFLTEFRAGNVDKVAGDFRHDQLARLPHNRFVDRPNGFALAGQLAKIEAFKGQSLIHDLPYVLQTRYLYEVALDPAVHAVTRRWVVRVTASGPINRGADNVLVAALSSAQSAKIERDLRLATGKHPSPEALTPIERAPTLPAGFSEYLDATRIPELQQHPVEVLTYVLLLGLSGTSALRTIRRDCAEHGFLVALNRLANDPRRDDPGVAIRNNLHAFRCLPELLDHLRAHERWLRVVAGHCDLEPAMLALLDEMILIGVRPQAHEIIYETEKMAFRFDNVATGDAFAHCLEPSPRSAETDPTAP